ncbi:MAG: DUF2628 domain-containing protein [Geminicoccaceae bacterium]
MADPASSENSPPSLDEAPAKAGPPLTSPLSRARKATFTNTKQHVADKQTGDGEVERFTNTKLNIALINDPKNGPRFTMTKRESGLSEDGADGLKQDALGQNASKQAPPSDAALPIAAASASVQPTEIPGGRTAPSPAEPRSDDAGPAARQPDRFTTPPTFEPAAAAKAPALPDGVPPAATPPSKVPVDSSKTFIGPNGTYYDESWRWMDWRGTRQSWNWPAALSFGHWFAYRRLYRFAGLYLLWLTGLAAGVVNNVPILALIALVFLVVWLTGVYGNTLYFRAFRRAVDHVTKTGEGNYQELQGQLARAGGTSVWALGVMGALSIAGIATAIVATHYVRGGFQVNFWPF